MKEKKGPNVTDVMTSGSHKKARKITNGIKEGENYPNHEAIDFYHHYMETEVKPMVNQIEFHPGQMQEETLKYCREIIY